MSEEKPLDLEATEATFAKGYNPVARALITECRRLRTERDDYKAKMMQMREERIDAYKARDFAVGEVARLREALQKIDEPMKYHHWEEDAYTRAGCFQFVAHEALKEIQPSPGRFLTADEVGALREALEKLEHWPRSERCPCCDEGIESADCICFEGMAADKEVREIVLEPLRILKEKP